MNLACVGARPLGLVNCLNFGNPEHPEVMWQLSESIDGMAEACRAFGIPVVGGNVSLYNESRGRDIDPTPVVGLVGVVDRLERPPPGVRLVDGGALVALGPDATLARRLAVGVGARGPRRRAARARPRPATPRSPTSCASSWSTGCSPGSTTPPTASAWRWPRWPCAAAGVRGRARQRSTTPGCSPSPPAGRARVRRTRSRRGGRAARGVGGVPVAALGRAGGDRLVVAGPARCGAGRCHRRLVGPAARARSAPPPSTDRARVGRPASSGGSAGRRRTT